jgi:hypothetical protein
MTTVLMILAVGLFIMQGGMVNHAEAQIVPFDVARICMQNIFRQRIDLRVYSASNSGPAGVWLVNGIYDLSFTCQEPATRFWPVHGAIVAKVAPKDFEALTVKGTLFRLNFEAGSIDPEASANCVKFKEGLTCNVESKGSQPEVSCKGFFTNLGLRELFTGADAWTPIACFEDPDDLESVPQSVPPRGPMPGLAQ